MLLNYSNSNGYAYSIAHTHTMRINTNFYIRNSLNLRIYEYIPKFTKMKFERFEK